VLHPGETLERAVEDRARRSTGRVGEEADAAGVPLAGWIGGSRVHWCALRSVWTLRLLL